MEARAIARHPGGYPLEGKDCGQSGAGESAERSVGDLEVHSEAGFSPHQESGSESAAANAENNL